MCKMHNLFCECWFTRRPLARLEGSHWLPTVNFSCFGDLLVVTNLLILCVQNFLRNNESEDKHDVYLTVNFFCSFQVIARIFYCVNSSWTGRITVPELRNSNFLEVSYTQDVVFWLACLRVSVLTLKLTWVTKTEFLLSLSIQYQAGE